MHYSSARRLPLVAAIMLAKNDGITKEPKAQLGLVHYSKLWTNSGATIGSGSDMAVLTEIELYNGIVTL